MNFINYITQNTQLAITVQLDTTVSRKMLISSTFKSVLKSQKAFTLAETLITLTIIGVIAAITVPNLVTNYTKHTYVVGLKKVYSQLQNAARLMPITENCSAGDYDCVGLIATHGNGITKTQLLANQFKTVKKVLTFEEAQKDEGCKLVGEMGAHGSLPCFYTQDGAIIASSNGIYVDINGLKGPNIIGRDQFWFTLATETRNGVPAGTIMAQGSKQAAAYNPYQYYTSVYWKTANYCTSQYVKKNTPDKGKAFHCTARVLEENAMNY